MLDRKWIPISIMTLMLLTCIMLTNWLLVDFREGVREAEENLVQSDILEYSEIRGLGQYQALFEHFPMEIPPSATNVHMMYSPAMFSKGLLFQLWFKLPQEELEKTQAEYDDIRVRNSGVVPHLARSYPALMVHKTKDNPQGESLPSGVDIKVLGFEHKDEGNHGYTYGIAINEATSDILYWAEAW